jgi:hypothetical protein
MLMLEIQKFLAGAGAEVNRIVGAPIELTLDANRYTSRMRRFFLPEAANESEPDKVNAQDLGEQIGVVDASTLRFVFSDSRKPGVYRFEFAAPGEGGRIDQQAVALNVDTPAEGDLRRASRDDIQSAAPGSALHSPGSGLADVLRERRSDLSESPWLFLLILLVLIAEQAMAVRLSYHIDSAAAPASAPGARTNAA